jgi:hypothetical protein
MHTQAASSLERSAQVVDRLTRWLSGHVGSAAPAVTLCIGITIPIRPSP